MADKLLENLNLVVPDLKETYWKRIRILQAILRFGPIGRKNLAEKLGLTERPLRKETDLLKEEKLIRSTTAGMKITSLGEEVLATAFRIRSADLASKPEEKALSKKLDIGRVSVVKGDLDQEPSIIAEMAMYVARYLDQELGPGEHTLAITGGTTMRGIANHLDDETLRTGRHFKVVSARGGLGESVDTQANSISSVLARNLGGESYSLYAPENVTEQTRESLMKEPSIQTVTDKLAKADAVLFSVGDAETMAERRGLSAERRAQLKADQAVGEAFGSFYNAQGEVVYQMPRIGLQLDQLDQIDVPILVAGGTIKARAVAAFAKLAPDQLILVTDSGVSDKVLNGETH